MAKNINKATKDERIQKVLKLMADGYMTWQICKICSDEWKVSRRAVERYLTEVYKFLKLSMKEKDKDKILIEYETLISKYELSGDSKMAYLYRVHRDKLTGMLVTKTDITSGGEKLQPAIINIIKPSGN